MDNKTNVKPEVCPSDEDLPNEKALYTADYVTRIKTEPTSSGNEFEMYNNTNIKVEASGHLQNEGQYFYKNLKKVIMKDTATSIYDIEMGNKTNIKEEQIDSDTELPNVEYFDCTSFATILKNDTKLNAEIDCKLEAHSVADIDSEESNSGTAEELPSSESPRFTSEAVYHDNSSHTFPCTSDVKASSGKNVAMRLNVSSLNCNPGEHFESVKNVGSEGILLYECTICEKRFNRHWFLKRHLLCHSQNKPYTCEHCRKNFTDKSNFNRHLLLHSATKPYNCEHCDKCFADKSYLKTHMLLHLGTKPYKCEHCQKCFTQRTHLRTHTLIHSGTKLYKCELCEKAYSVKSRLKTHILTHSGIKPYPCKHCDKSYMRKSHLNRHILLHSDTK